MSSTAEQPPSDSKNERIESSVAASAKGPTGDLAHGRARRVLHEHQHMILTGADRELFLEAVLNPVGPAPKLIKALRQHRKLLG
jgi:hypothetical protein